MPSLPKLGYPITRRFPWPWFTPTVYASLFVLVPVLIVVNVALAGYEIQTVFQKDYNARDNDHWYSPFMPEYVRHKKRCEKHMFYTGDRFITNTSFFQYTVETIDSSNTDGQGIAYDGSTLDGCSIEKIFMTMDARDWTMELSPILNCTLYDDQGKPAVMHSRTDLRLSFLPGRVISTLASLRSVHTNSASGAVNQNSNSNTQNSQKSNISIVRSSQISGFNQSSYEMAGELIQTLAMLAYQDYFFKVFSDVNNNFDAPTILGLEANSTFKCSNSADPCAFQAAGFNVSHELYVDMSLKFFLFNHDDGIDNRQSARYDDVLLNVLRLVQAAVELDIGRNLPRNFLTNSSAVNQSIHSEIYQDMSVIAPFVPRNGSLLSHSLNNPQELADLGLEYPLPHNESSSVIQVEYACGFQVPKSPGSAAAAVIAATVTMYSSAWAALMIISNFFVKRRDPNAMKCEHHQPEVDLESNALVVDLKKQSAWADKKLYARVRSDSPPPT